MKCIKHSLLRADLESLNDEFDVSELDSSLRHQVSHLVESEMNRAKKNVYQRVSIKKVKSSSSSALSNSQL